MPERLIEMVKWLDEDQTEFSDNVFPVHDLDTADPGLTIPFNMHWFDPDRPQASYPHRHSFYQVLLTTAGQGFHVVDFESLPINPPMFFFVSPGQVHFWQLEKPLQGYGLLFGPDFLVFNAVDTAGFDKLALFHSLSHTPLQLGSEQAASFEIIMEALAQEYAARALNYASVLSAYLHILLSQIQRLYIELEPDTSINPEAELVRRFRQLVAEHFLDQRSVAFYADQLGVNHAYLSERVKTITGRTAGQIIRQELTLEAKRLLINTDLTIGQISYQLAFNDQAYFGRFFKRETSTSPGKYRQDIREKYQINRV